MPTEDEMLLRTTQEFEAGFSTVSDEVGFPVQYEGSSVTGGREQSRAPNGAEYMSVASGGLKPPGMSQKWRFRDDAETACATWLASARALASTVTNGDPVSLYWRSRPEFEEWEGKISVFSRFAVGGREDV